MTFLAPAFFFASLAVAAAVIALHLIVTRQPRAGVLPTARFVPDIPATATARATRPSDLLLMLLRVLLVLAVGTGLARPVLKPSRSDNARVILLDASRSSVNVPALRDSARSLYRAGDAVVLFDSSARIVGGNVADSLRVVEPSRHPGNLSAALLAALRAGSTLRDRADSLELVIVSPLAAEEADAATTEIRRLWPGRARLVRVQSSAAPPAPASPELQITTVAADPLAISVALANRSAPASATISRDGPREIVDTLSAGDRPIVEWPATSRPRWATQRSRADTIGGVISGAALVVAGFERSWSFPPDSLRGAEVVARWIDGEPAAIERAAGDGCVRSVAIPVNPVGDLVIRNDFIRFVSAMGVPCAQRLPVTPMSASLLASLAGSGGLASRDAFKPREDATSSLAPWLFALALAAAVAELFLRRRQTERAVVERVERKAAA